MTANELVGRRVRQARKSLSLNQEELGQQLEPYIGKAWSPQAVSDAELGRRVFDPAELMAFAVVLRRPVAWFLIPDAPDVEVKLSDSKKGTIRGADLVTQLSAEEATNLAASVEQLGEIMLRVRSHLDAAQAELSYPANLSVFASLMIQQRRASAKTKVRLREEWEKGPKTPEHLGELIAREAELPEGPEDRPLEKYAKQAQNEGAKAAPRNRRKGG